MLKKQWFTLIEVLVVIVIMVILLSIGISVRTIVDEKSRTSHTVGKIAAFEQAQERYKAEYGTYFINCELTAGGKLKRDGLERFNPDPQPELRGKKFKTGGRYSQDQEGMYRFCSFSEMTKLLNKQKYPDYEIVTFLGSDYTFALNPDVEGDKTGYRDGWGNLFYYRYPGTYNNSKYDFWSAGPDGKSDFKNPSADVNKDDITNWTK